MDFPIQNTGPDYEDLLVETLAILERDDVTVNEDDLVELIEADSWDADPHSVAYKYLTEVDGSFTEEEAREIAWF